ncbi:uncharacterized protein LOC143218320 [Lasioglossum baleicum]|uniref:uncharacterized protein LOC143218320 n=1 Tax=Lasioglossum baleicum TaxID=434251 RepID=UPI003FCEC64B
MMREIMRQLSRKIKMEKKRRDTSGEKTVNRSSRGRVIRRPSKFKEFNNASTTSNCNTSQEPDKLEADLAKLLGSSSDTEELVLFVDPPHPASLIPQSPSLSLISQHIPAPFPDPVRCTSSPVSPNYPPPNPTIVARSPAPLSPAPLSAALPSMEEWQLVQQRMQEM